MSKNYYNNSGPHTRVVIILIAVLIVAVVAIYIEKIHHKSASNTSNNHKTTLITGTTSKPTPHTPSPSTANNSSFQGNTSNQSIQPSNTTAVPPKSQWTTSSSGTITLQQPYPNATIQSGSIISGTIQSSSIHTVNFILTDNAVGQIAQGSLSVVNGKFSGSLNFTSHSSSGTLQVYSPNPTNGAEENIINFDVKYN